MRKVGIYIWRNKAYLPVQAQLKSGAFVDIDPVYTASLNRLELQEAVQKVLAAGHPLHQDLTQDEWRKRKSPTLAATKARSWRQLEREGTTYTIAWNDSNIVVNLSGLDAKGQWGYDLDKRTAFPLDTPLVQVVDTILTDIESCVPEG